MESYSESYRKAGVDITAGYQGVKLMGPHVARTMHCDLKEARRRC